MTGVNQKTKKNTLKKQRNKYKDMRVII